MWLVLSTDTVNVFNVLLLRPVWLVLSTDVVSLFNVLLLRLCSVDFYVYMSSIDASVL